MSKKRTKNKPSIKAVQQPQDQSQKRLLVHEHQEQYIFQGPLPAPQILEQYNQIVPDAAERILRMAEKDADFQREITHKAIDTEAKERKRGQIFGICIGLAALTERKNLAIPTKNFRRGRIYFCPTESTQISSV